MICIGARRTEELLPLDELAAEVAAVLNDVGNGSIAWHERVSLAPQKGGATIFSMVAGDSKLVVSKTIAANPMNLSHDLPTVDGIVAVFDSFTGAPLLLLDGPVLTARRTAAVSLVAIHQLHPKAESALVVGTGALGRTHIEGLATLPLMKRILIQGRRPGQLARLVQFGRTLGMDCHAAPDGAAAADCDIALTVTNSEQPVLRTVNGRTRLVIAVGSYKPTMAELSPAIVAGASGIYVDVKAGARCEAGELAHANLNWDKVQELRDIVIRPPAPSDTGFRIFKSVGHSLWDLAAARLAYRHFRQNQPMVEH